MANNATGISSDTSSNKYGSDLELIRRIGDRAAAVSMARFMAQDLVIETKPDSTPVTDADKATEKAIREILEAERPNDGILGEEGQTIDGTSGSTQISAKLRVPWGTSLQARCGLRFDERMQGLSGPGWPKANSAGIGWPGSKLSLRSFMRGRPLVWGAGIKPVD